MNVLQIALHKSCRIFVALIVLAVVSFAGAANAQSGFALIGTWEHTERVAQNAPANTSMWIFRPNGTCSFEYGTAYSGGSGQTQMHCKYRPTGATSLSITVQAYRLCTGGICNSCPLRRGEMPGNACAAAQVQGMTPGKQWQTSVRMQGPNQYTADDGTTWSRVR
jgi:hypothetical protein